MSVKIVVNHCNRVIRSTYPVVHHSKYFIGTFQPSRSMGNVPLSTFYFLCFELAFYYLYVAAIVTLIQFLMHIVKCLFLLDVSMIEKINEIIQYYPRKRQLHFK